MTKCSIQSIAAADAACAAERDRLQCYDGAFSEPSRSDPLSRAPPAAPPRPSEVEMLVEGLREIEMEGE